MSNEISYVTDTSGADAIAANLPETLRQGRQKIALDIQAYVQTHWSPNGPSSPGEAPAVDTGALTNSMQVWEKDANTTAVGDGVDYGKLLEYGTVFMPARPFLTPAVDAIRPTVPDAFKISTVRRA